MLLYLDMLFFFFGDSFQIQSYTVAGIVLGLLLDLRGLLLLLGLVF